MTDQVALLRSTRTIAVVGASPRPDRESNGVMRYLMRAGYRCIPVRADGAAVLGVPSVASLHEIDGPIDLVDIFRRSEFCADHVREAVDAGARAVWLQLGIVSTEARAIAEAAGIPYVEDACTAVVHAHGSRR